MSFHWLIMSILAQNVHLLEVWMVFTLTSPLVEDKCEIKRDIRKQGLTRFSTCFLTTRWLDVTHKAFKKQILEFDRQNTCQLAVLA